MSDTNKAEFEKKLEEAGEKFGLMMNKASAEEKAKMKNMMNEINSFVEEEGKNSKCYDKSALFAAAIIAEPSFPEEIKILAKEYIEADYLFVKSKEEA